MVIDVEGWLAFSHDILKRGELPLACTFEYKGEHMYP